MRERIRDKMKHRIIPTVFALNKEDFYKRFNKLIGITNYLQIDFMDGKFVKAKSVKIEDVPDCHEYWGKFEAHLMARNPEKYIEKLKEKGFFRVIFHYEALRNDNKIINLISEIKRNRMKAVIAINPSTGLDKILGFLDRVNGVLFMGVNPGKENQKFIFSVYEKIAELRKINRKIEISVDGGVNFSNIGKLRDLGVNYINSGGLISNSSNPKKMLKALKRAFR